MVSHCRGSVEGAQDEQLWQTGKKKYWRGDSHKKRPQHVYAIGNVKSPLLPPSFGALNTHPPKKCTTKTFWDIKLEAAHSKF